MRTKDSRTVLRGLGVSNASQLPGGLKRKQEVYQTTGRSISGMELHRELNQLKQSELPWMYEVSKCAPQEAQRDLDDAYTNFFHRVQLKQEGKWKGPPGYPSFKTKRQGLGSFRLTGSLHVYEQAIDLPRLGRLRLKECGYLPFYGVNVLSATVSEEAGLAPALRGAAGDGPT